MWKRIGRALLFALALAVVFVLALILGTALHLGLGSTRAMVVRDLNRRLESRFVGRVEIERIDELSLTSLGGADLRVRDDGDEPVMRLEDVSIDWSLWRTARSLVGRARPRIAIDEVAISQAEIWLDPTAPQLAIAEVFSSPAPEPGAGMLAVSIERLRLDRAKVHATVPERLGIRELEAQLAAIAGRLTVTEDRVRIGLDRAVIATRNAPPAFEVRGVLRGSLGWPLDGGERTAELAYLGSVAGLMASLHASLDGERVDSSLLVGPVATAWVEELVPALEGPGLLTLRANVGGTTSRLAGRALLTATGPGIAEPMSLLVTAGWRKERSRQLELHVEARRLAIDRLLADAPPLAGSFDAHIDASLAEGGPRGSYTFQLHEGRYGDIALPPADLEGRFERDRVEVRGEMRGAGLPLELDGELARRDSTTTIRIDVAGKDVQLGRVPLAPEHLGGRGAVSAHADLVLGTDGGFADARLDARLFDVAVGPIEAGLADVEARVVGPLDTAEVDASVEVRDARVAGRELERVTIEVAGRLDRLRAELLGVEAGPPHRRVAAEAVVRVLDGALELDAVRADLRAPQTRLELEIPSARIAGGQLIAEGVTLEGAGGRAELALRREPGGTRLDVDVRGMKLGELGRLLGLATPLAGEISLSGYAARRRGRLVEAEIRGRGRALELDGVGGIEARLEARLADRRLDVELKVEGDDVRMALDTDGLELGGHPLDPGSWHGATGELEVAVRGRAAAIARLARRAGLVSDDRLPARMGGGIGATLTARRKDRSAPPDLAVVFDTDALCFGPVAMLGDTAMLGPLDVDGSVEVSAAGEGEIELHLADSAGDLAWLDADVDLAYRSLWQARFAPLLGEDRWSWLRARPIALWAHLEQRRAEELPVAMGTREAQGTLGATVWAEGSLAEPRGGVLVRTVGLRAPGLPLEEPIDMVLAGGFQPAQVNAGLEVFNRGRRVLHARAVVEAAPVALVTGDLPPDWSARGTLAMRQLPLRWLSPLARRRIAGWATGSVELERLNQPGVRFTGTVRLDRLRIGETPFRAARLVMDGDDRSLNAHLTMQHLRGGYAGAAVHVPVSWRGPLPALDESRTGRVKLDARDFRLSAVQPLLEGTFDTLEGRLDADAELTIVDGEPRVSGRAEVSQGSFQLSNFGETFVDARASLSADPNGVVRLTRFEAHSIGGQILAKGIARIHGWDLQTAVVNAVIPEKHPLPLVIAGRHIGELSARLQLRAALNDVLRVEIDVEQLRAELERGAGEGVQKLEPAEQIRIGVVEDGRFRRLALGAPEPEGRGPDALPIHISVDLGKDAQLRREQLLEVSVRGTPRIEITDRVRTEGEIQLVDGTLDVQGKELEIREGVVTLTGYPPSNPYIRAVAAWRAPDGTEVIAEFTGPAQTGNIELRADPPMPKDEIVALLLFGGTAGAAPTVVGEEEPTRATQAVGVGGAILARGVNEALEDLTSLDIAARVDTSRLGQPATELEWRVTRNVSLVVAHVFGTPRLGDNPDKNYASVEWRFRHNWSLDTTVGDQGSAMIDLLWHHRY